MLEVETASKDIHIREDKGSIGMNKAALLVSEHVLCIFILKWLVHAFNFILYLFFLMAF